MTIESAQNILKMWEYASPDSPPSDLWIMINEVIEATKMIEKHRCLDLLEKLRLEIKANYDARPIELNNHNYGNRMADLRARAWLEIARAAILNEKTLSRD